MNKIEHAVEGRLAMCADGCTSTRAGHAVLPIQRVVAAASPSAYRDAFVTSIEDDRVELAAWDDARIVIRTHDTAALTVGEPVSFHPVAGVLSVAGGALLSVD